MTTTLYTLLLTGIVLAIMDESLEMYLSIKVKHLLVQIQMFLFKMRLLAGIYTTRLLGEYKYRKIAKDILREVKEREQV
jgi:hypothetical protein